MGHTILLTYSRDATNHPLPHPIPIPKRKVIYAQSSWGVEEKTNQLASASWSCVLDLCRELGAADDKQPKTILLALIECKYNFALLSSLVSSRQGRQQPCTANEVRGRGRGWQEKGLREAGRQADSSTSRCRSVDVYDDVGNKMKRADCVLQTRLLQLLPAESEHTLFLYRAHAAPAASVPCSLCCSCLGAEVSL